MNHGSFTPLKLDRYTWIEFEIMIIEILHKLQFLNYNMDSLIFCKLFMFLLHSTQCAWTHFCGLYFFKKGYSMKDLGSARVLTVILPQHLSPPCVIWASSETHMQTNVVLFPRLIREIKEICLHLCITFDNNFIGAISNRIRISRLLLLYGS